MENFNTQHLFSVKGRVAVVTGGSSGIGFMIAKVGSERVIANKVKAENLSRHLCRTVRRYTLLLCQ